MGENKFTLKIPAIGYEESRTLCIGDDAGFFVKVRASKKIEDFDGSFGFDWIDLNPNNGLISEIQGASINDLEYYFKDNESKVVTDPLDTELHDFIKSKYGINTNCKTKVVDIPYVLIKPQQQITLYLTVTVPDVKKLKDKKNYISLKSDKFYKFEIVKGTIEGDVTKKKITGNCELELKVTCLKEASEMLQYNICQKCGLAVGGFKMMENKVLKLKFRVIALVSNDGKSIGKAKKLFKTFKDSKILKHLNEESLNQAGYEVEIENQVMFNNIDEKSVSIDEYVYAFDKDDWGKKGLYSVTEIENEKGECIETGVIHYKNKYTSFKLEEEITTEYNNKLIDKNKSYNSFVIVLLDYNGYHNSYKDQLNTSFSSSIPLDYQKLFVYKKYINDKISYSHEIGHMLGLEHPFYEKTELKEYKKNREIIRSEVIKVRESSFGYGTKGFLSLITKKEALFFLKNFNKYFEDVIAEEVTDEDEERVAEKEALKDGVQQNIKMIKKIKKLKDTGYIYVQGECYLTKIDFITLYNAQILHITKIIKQLEGDYIKFTEEYTYNIMDYENTPIYFSHHQIKIMRNDIKNYRVIPCNYCKNN